MFKDLDVVLPVLPILTIFRFSSKFPLRDKVAVSRPFWQYVIYIKFHIKSKPRPEEVELKLWNEQEVENQEMVHSWPLLLWRVLPEVLLNWGRAGAITLKLAVSVSSGALLLHLFFVCYWFGAVLKLSTTLETLQSCSPCNSFMSN